MPSPESLAPRLSLRVVLFMSTPAAGDIPVRGSLPASLLPFGCVTFAEQVLDSCARAGLREIDLVLSEQPEALRAHLGDGWRWGLKLNWHLAKESSTPYGSLHSMGLTQGRRVLIGHGDRWVSEQVVRALVETDRVALRVMPAMGWSGWASMTSEGLEAIAPHADFDVLAVTLVKQLSGRALMVPAGEFAGGGTAVELMQAQALALRDDSGLHVPATWIRMPWGAMSPDAHVHAQADLRGPVLIGPRSTVGRDAQVGPGTVLSRDVLVASGAVVSDALVLPETYLSGGVTMEHSVVQGNVVQDLRWSARMVLPLRDGVLGTLAPTSVRRAAWAARLLAAMAALFFLPAFAVLALVQRLRRQPAGWTRIDAVTGRRAESGELEQVVLRESPAGADLKGWLQGRYGALLDVAQGRRHWFGIRPRKKAQWYALRRDWQILFSDQPIGYFHAPAWADRASHPDGEALAAADAFFTVRASFGERMRLLLALVRSSGPGRAGRRASAG